MVSAGEVADASTDRRTAEGRCCDDASAGRFAIVVRGVLVVCIIRIPVASRRRLRSGMVHRVSAMMRAQLRAIAARPLMSSAEASVERSVKVETNIVAATVPTEPLPSAVEFL